MLLASRFAFLVMTAEDQDEAGFMHARENVVHEIGLFQGKLGWRRAVILLEDGCTEFSNIHGLSHIKFSKGQIEKSFAEVEGALTREGAI